MTAQDSRLEWVQAGSLTIDFDYQRSQSEQHVQKIVDEWNELRLAPIVVSERDDKSLYVVEGQHRVAAAIIVHGAEYELPALIWSGLTKADEADAWGANTRRKSTTGPQEHRAMVVAGNDAVASAIEKVLSDRGLTIGNPTTTTISGVKTLRWVVQQYDEKMLATVLDTLEEAYGKHKDTWNANTIKGLALFYDRYGIEKKRHARIIRALREGGVLGSDPAKASSATTFANNAIHGLAGGGGTASRAPRVAEYLVQKYNFGLDHAKRLGSWR